MASFLRTAYLALGLAAFLGCAAPKPIALEIPPLERHLPRTSPVDIEHYALELALDPRARSLAGECRIRFLAHTARRGQARLQPRRKRCTLLTDCAQFAVNVELLHRDGANGEHRRRAEHPPTAPVGRRSACRTRLRIDECHGVRAIRVCHHLRRCLERIGEAHRRAAGRYRVGDGLLIAVRPEAAHVGEAPTGRGQQFDAVTVAHEQRAGGIRSTRRTARQRRLRRHDEFHFHTGITGGIEHRAPRARRHGRGKSHTARAGGRDPHQQGFPGAEEVPARGAHEQSSRIFVADGRQGDGAHLHERRQQGNANR